MIASQDITDQASRQEQDIEALAREQGAAIDEVREIYLTEYSRLASVARVKTYVSVIATRLARNVLQSRH